MTQRKDKCKLCETHAPGGVWGAVITAREKFLNSSLSAFPIPVNSVKQANSLTVQHTYILP